MTRRLPNRASLKLLRLLREEPWPEGAPPHPRLRADCIDGPRPCPWVSCRHHLAAEVDPATGSLVLLHPEWPFRELQETCALDVADAGGNALGVAGGLLGVSKELVRQIEVRALVKMKGGWQ